MIGRTLGHYRIVEKVGEGGMGRVYRARDERLDRDVALKLLTAPTLADETVRKRFRREAQVLARLSHSNIGTVFDFNSLEGTDFLVMEFVEGSSLADILTSGPLPEKEVAKIGAQVAAALEEAHAQDVTHRDLKPGNIMITPRNQVKVLDFGLAKLRSGKEADDATDAITRAQVAVGTLPYMAPEQLRGEKVDGRTDVFALGAVLYEMTTGRRPFTDTLVPRLIDSILNKLPLAPRAVDNRISPELERIILKCLEKDPEDRYQSAKELEIDLRRFLAPPSASAILPATRPRKGLRIGLAAGASLVVLAGVLWMLDAGGLRSRLGPARPQMESLAVLPLANLSGDTQQNYFADGMTEALIMELSRIRALKVTSRTTVMRYKGAQKSLPEIARELGVDAVLEGSVVREGDRVRITAQLVDARNDSHIWANRFDADLKDVLKMQSDIARAVTEQVQAALTPTEVAGLAAARTVNPAAYDAYLRGRAAFYEYDVNGLNLAIQLYQQALDRDRDFAPALSGMALAFAGFHNLGESTDPAYLERAKTSARAAIRLQPALAEGHFALGFAESMGGNWIEARAAYMQALALEPNHAHAHAGLGYVYENTGLLDWAETESERARLLDPQLGPSYWHLNNVFHARGDHRKALAVLEDSVVRDWALSAWQRARELNELGEVEKLRQLAQLGKRYNWYIASVALAEALVDYREGRTAQARKRMAAVEMIRTSNPRGAGIIASTLASAGDQSLALEWLALAVSRGYANYPLLAYGSEYSAMQSDPKFQALLAEVRARHEKCKAAWQ